MKPLQETTLHEIVAAIADEPDDVVPRSIEGRAAGEVQLIRAMLNDATADALVIAESVAYDGALTGLDLRTARAWVYVGRCSIRSSDDELIMAGLTADELIEWLHDIERNTPPKGHAA